MSYLAVTKLQYAVTLAQESGFPGYAWAPRFPQQCPFSQQDAASLWQRGVLTGTTANNKISSKVPPGEAAHFISGARSAKVGTGFAFDRALVC
jgi:hypothetical protein